MRFANLKSMAFSHQWSIRQNEAIQATPTPFPSLNRIIGDDGGGVGIPHQSEFFLTVGGGTGQGKSLLSQNLATYALQHGRRIGFLSLEMSHFQMASRFYAMATGTPIAELARGRLTADAWDKVYAGVCDMCEHNTGADFFINEEPLHTLDDVMEASRYLRGDLGVDWIILDYMQMCSTGDEESIYKTVTKIGGELREFAYDEKIHAMALSQYNTPQGRDTSQPPTMYGLMGGATIANNGNLVLLLDHSRYERDKDRRHIARTYLLVPKNRSGDTGEIPIEWDYRTLRVREAMPDEEHLWPKGNQ